MSFPGIYRGVVVRTDDPKRMHRVRARVPDVMGDEVLGWALPCVPPSSPYAVPVEGDAVWVLFEGGDSARPVWMGTWASPGVDPPKGSADITGLPPITVMGEESLEIGLAAEGVTTGLLADLAVTTLKLADGAVTTGKLANLAVTTGKLADDTVTTGKLDDGSVTPPKTSSGILLTDGSRNPSARLKYASAPAGTDPLDIIARLEVSEALNGKVNRDGDTMTGNLHITGEVKVAETFGLIARQANGIPASRIPNDWPEGITTAQCTVGSGWPTNGPVMNLRQTDTNYGWQIQLAVGSVFMRRPVGGGADWHPWVRLEDFDGRPSFGTNQSLYPSLFLNRVGHTRWEIGPSSTGGNDMLVRRDDGSHNGLTIRARGSDTELQGRLGVLFIEGASVRSETIRDATTGFASNVFIATGGGTLQRSTSSRRYKRDIRPMTDDEADRIFAIEPIRFRSKCKADRKDWSHYGCTAEQVAEVDPRLVQFRQTDDDGDIETDDDGNPIAESVQYDRMVPHLINIARRQRDTIAEQTDRIETLESQMADLMDRVRVLESDS